MDLVAEIAARYGAVVSPHVTVQRIPPGASARPLPVWDGKKLIVPDWKEQRKALQASGVRRSAAARRRGQAQDAELMARLIDMNAAGMRPPAIAAATGLTADQVYRLLKQAGHPVQRDTGMVQKQLARDAQIRALVEAGKSLPAIGIAIGVRPDSQWLRQLVRRAVPEHVFEGRWGRRDGEGRTRRRGQMLDRIRALAAEGADLARIGQSVDITNEKYLRQLVRQAVPGITLPPMAPPRPKTLDRIRALLDEGASLDRIGAAVGIRDPRTLRRRIRQVCPGYVFDSPPQGRALASRDAEVARLYPDHDRRAIAGLLGLTVPQVICAIRRAREAGLLPRIKDATAKVKARPKPGSARRAPVAYHRERDARIMELHRAGLTVEAIMSETGHSREIIKRVVRKNGDTIRNDRSTTPALLLSELPDLVAQGLTGQQIADRWGRKLSFVYSLASRNGVTLNGTKKAHNSGSVTPKVAARRELIRHMIAKGMTHREMLDVLGINQSTLSHDIKEAGLSGLSAYAQRVGKRRSKVEAQPEACAQPEGLAA